MPSLPGVCVPQLVWPLFGVLGRGRFSRKPYCRIFSPSEVSVILLVSLSRLITPSTSSRARRRGSSPEEKMNPVKPPPVFLMSISVQPPSDGFSSFSQLTRCSTCIAKSSSIFQPCIFRAAKVMTTPMTMSSRTAHKLRYREPS